MYPTLEAAWAKYDRAVEDLSTLRKEAGWFLDTQPFGVEVKFEKETGWHVAYSTIREEPPPRLGVLVGAIGYECLSALNHIVWALTVRKIGQKRASARRRQVEFPIHKRSADFWTRPVVRDKLVSKQAVAVLESLQPYRGAFLPDGTTRDSPFTLQSLFLVKDLADTDKHRVLAAGYGRVDLNGLWSGESLTWDTRARGPTIERILPPRVTSTRNRVVKSGTKLARVRFDVGNANANVHVDPQPSANVLFATDTRGGISLLMLGGCIVDTDRCLTRLATLFPREPWPPASVAPPS